MKRTMELDKGLDSKINELFWILFLRLFFFLPAIWEKKKTKANNVFIGICGSQSAFQTEG